MSWITADTKESIAIFGSNIKCNPVYLLQPMGREAILEERYAGYGEFGGTDALVWLAKNNLPKDLINESNDNQRLLGSYLMHGWYLLSGDGEVFYLIYEDGCDNEAKTRILSELENVVPVPFKEYESVCIVDGIESNISEHIGAGRLVYKEIIKSINHPLKFSFSRDAVYEKLNASFDCVNQGLTASH